MIAFATIKSVVIEKGARILKFLLYGDRDVQESDEIAPFGVDSAPPSGMVALYAPTSIEGETVIIGYINEKQIAGIGELRLYSTDANGKEVKTYIWLKNDGHIELGGALDNAVRFSKLEEGFNQLRADLNSLITIFNTHVHSGGTISGSTGTTATPGTASGANISAAKINEIKVP